MLNLYDEGTSLQKCVFITSHPFVLLSQSRIDIQNVRHLDTDYTLTFSLIHSPTHKLRCRFVHI
jgi:hypothetical protein